MNQKQRDRINKSIKRAKALGKDYPLPETTLENMRTVDAFKRTGWHTEKLKRG